MFVDWSKSAVYTEVLQIGKGQHWHLSIYSVVNNFKHSQNQTQRVTESANTNSV